LLLSRLTAGVEEARTHLDLEPLALEVFDVGSRLAQGSGVSLRLNEATPAPVIGDGRALRRALLNLVENAVKYTPAGGKVELALVRHDGRAELSVRDTGPGIEPAQIERIFHPFVRLDEARTRAQGGAGLGLAIARSIILAHGGTIDAESTAGAGSCFTIRLPLAPGPA
jgi:signal transduction histidine kinase